MWFFENMVRVTDTCIMINVTKQCGVLGNRGKRTRQEEGKEGRRRPTREET